ncbi:hypothetical protein BDV96DRAFT_645051 [Lophiotrema nucula]|uniref:Uncharacterized protein n=1 Tax=Lophiotrema nucula TaxID=690887 RepID=A0A6A5ZAY4_9PLEO|nr:hypothetical protein BDV96DRAFT_645051 [Lophiotrema nucula]
MDKAKGTFSQYHQRVREIRKSFLENLCMKGIRHQWGCSHPDMDHGPEHSGLKVISLEDDRFDSIEISCEDLSNLIHRVMSLNELVSSIFLRAIEAEVELDQAISSGRKVLYSMRTDDIRQYPDEALALALVPVMDWKLKVQQHVEQSIHKVEEEIARLNKDAAGLEIRPEAERLGLQEVAKVLGRMPGTKPLENERGNVRTNFDMRDMHKLILSGEVDMNYVCLPKI